MHPSLARTPAGAAGWATGETGSTTSINVSPIVSRYLLPLNSHHAVIVFENGKSGFLGEHSCMDGTPTLRLNEFMLASLASGKADLGPERTVDTAKNLEIPTELTFALDDKTHQYIKQAESHFDELVGKHDMHVCRYRLA